MASIRVSKVLSVIAIIMLGLFPKGSSATSSKTYSTENPERIGSIIVDLHQEKRFYYYCYAEIRFFDDGDSENCDKSYESLNKIALSASYVSFKRKDSQTLLRILEFIVRNTGGR
jgi:hypothetical protein